MTELTEAEKLAMQRALNGSTSGSVCGMLLTRAVERIIDARLAPIRALADKWEDEAAPYLPGGAGYDVNPDTIRARADCRSLDAYRLRAALSAHESAPQPHHGTGSQPDDERACGAPVDGIQTCERPVGHDESEAHAYWPRWSFNLTEGA